MFYEQRKLPLPNDYKTSVQLSEELRSIKLKFDVELKNNLVSKKRFVVVCGPCSADDPATMHKYLVQLKKVANECRNLLFVARIYTAKPHSDGRGYKGSAFNLHESDSVDIDSGIRRCRQMMLDCLSIGLPVADELLYPQLYECVDDLVSYWFVGARSSEDSLHRDFASGLDVCCGVKNTTDGSIGKTMDSLYAIAHPHVFPYRDAQIATDGCKYAHIVLRGGQVNGAYETNISPQDISQTRHLLKQRGLSDFIMADLNHANSGKVALNQIENARLALREKVDGVMVESYMYSGKQIMEFGVSQTDDCLDFATTENLLREINAFLGRN